MAHRFKVRIDKDVVKENSRMLFFDRKEQLKKILWQYATFEMIIVYPSPKPIK